MRERAEYDELVRLLTLKFNRDPKKFRAYLPEVAQMLDEYNPPPEPKRSPFVLTEKERAFHQDSLANIFARLDEKGLSVEQAVEGLEHCAVLLEDYFLLEGVRHDDRVKLLKAAVGKSPGSFRRNETIMIADGKSSEDVVNKLSFVRGVYLELDREFRLVSISVVPRQVRERKKLMAIVGMIDDPVTDVSTRYEDYLYGPETDLRGSAQ